MNKLICLLISLVLSIASVSVAQNHHPVHRPVHHQSHHQRPPAPVHHPVHHQRPPAPVHHPVHHQRPPAPVHQSRPVHHPVHHHRTYIERPVYWNSLWIRVHKHPYGSNYSYLGSQYGSDIIALQYDMNYVYMIMRDRYSSNTYFSIFDNSDRLLFKYRVPYQYCKLIVDENGICILKLDNSDPIYFVYNGEQWYPYE